jgi:hypothetical protein
MSEAIDTTALRPVAPAEGEPTGELIREAFDDAGTLVKLEVALAREEIKSEIQRARDGAIAFGVAYGVGVAGATLLLVAVALASASAWLVALVAGAVLLAVAIVLGVLGMRKLPTRPMHETQERLASDVKELRERIT